MGTCSTGRLMDLPLKKSLTVIKVRPLRCSGAYLSHCIILPSTYTVSLLTTGTTRGCFTNVPFPTQVVAVCRPSIEKLSHSICSWPLCTMARVLYWEEWSDASFWSWCLARIIQGHVNSTAKCFFLPSWQQWSEMHLISSDRSLSGETLPSSNLSSTALKGFGVLLLC